MSITFDKNVAVNITNTSELPCTIRKKVDCHFLRSDSGAIQAHKPVDMARLNLIPEGDANQTTCLNELTKTDKPEQQRDTF